MNLKFTYVMIQVLADTIVQINGTKICEINYYSAIINTFDPAYDKLKRKKTIRCFMELMESFYNEQKRNVELKFVWQLFFLLKRYLRL